MKSLLLSVVYFLAFSGHAAAQMPQTFDIISFTPPAGWAKQTSADSVRLSTEDKTTGAYCLITVFRSLPGTADSKANFDVTWQAIVVPTAKPTAAAEMIAPQSDDGWKVESGFAQFDNDGGKGIALLVTSTGYGKMVNALILTNTQAYEPQVTAFLESISLKKPVVEVGTAKPTGSTQAVVPSPAASGYGYSTTNFDDGWTSTVQEDWVQVTKGNGKVLIHYPNKSADAYNSVVLEGLRNAWNVLVSPKYSSASNFQFKPTGSWETIEFAEATAVEIATGKTVHVVLFRKGFRDGSGKYMEFIYPDKGSFEQEFGTYPTTSFGTGPGFDKMIGMSSYNKFGIKAADLKGKWTNDFSGSLSYVNAYTGAAAGTDTHASIESFAFGPGGTYNWDLGVASGMVGNIKFQGVKSSGKVSVPRVWQATFSSIEGKPRTYNAHFSAVKGTRILWLDGKPFGRL